MGLNALSLNSQRYNDDVFKISITNLQIVESCVEGLRKPNPMIYKLILERLAVDPTEAVFLDDLGENLKNARALGVYTIKVYF